MINEHVEGVFKIKLLGKPTGQGRPRYSSRPTKSGKNFVSARDPDISRDYKNFARLVATNKADEIKWAIVNDGIMSVNILAEFSVPNSKPKKFKERALNECLGVTKKPDIDNIAKIVLDSLSGIVFKDDSQVATLHVAKRYGERDAVYVIVEECDN